MKNLITSLLLATALVPSVLSAASAKTTHYAIPVNLVTTNEGMQIEIGATEGSVRSALGEPAERLSSNVWAYHNYHPVQDLPKDLLGCNTLLVTMEKHKVTDLKLLSRKSIPIVARNLRNKALPAAVFVAQKN